MENKVFKVSICKVLPYCKVDYYLNQTVMVFKITSDLGVFFYKIPKITNTFSILYINNLIFIYGWNIANLVKTLNTVLNIYMLGLIFSYKIYLKIKGFGFKTQVKDGVLYLKIGYSHLNIFKIPSNLKIKRVKKNKLKLMSSNLFTISLVAKIIKNFRVPSAYRDKGISYENEQLKFKAGKKSKF